MRAYAPRIVALLVLACAAPATPAEDKRADELVGLWQSEVDPSLTYRFEAGRLHIVLAEGDGKPRVALVGDYGVTRDHIVYGVITSAKLPGEVALYVSVLDEPFRFRFRVDDDVLTVKDVKLTFVDNSGEFLKNVGVDKAEIGKGLQELKYLVFSVKSLLQGSFRKTTPQRLEEERRKAREAASTSYAPSNLSPAPKPMP